MATDTGESLRHELDGVLVIACSQALSDRIRLTVCCFIGPASAAACNDSPTAKDLERQLLKIQRQDPVLALQLTTISTDPLRYGLNRQISHFEEQAAQIRRRYPDGTQASQRAQELEKLRGQTLALLRVPVNAARSLALTHLQEQRRSASMVARLPTWLATLAAPDAARLKSLTSACIQALQRSHEQLETILIPRTTFTRRHLQAQLRKDFSLKGDFDVQLNLPDSVTLQKQLTDGAAPGTRKNWWRYPVPPEAKMTLEELAQLNIDNTPSMQRAFVACAWVSCRVEVDPGRQ